MAFPLLTEPVIWLSASPDLWACCLALAALWAAVPTGDGRAGRAAAAGVLYLGALLSKESALTLPLIVAVLWPWRQVRRTVLLMAAAAGAYLAVRVVVFAGLGGYLDSGGRSVLWSPNLVGLLRSLIGDRRPAAPVQGTLFWLPPRFGRFNSTEAASFFFGPRAAAEIVIRLPPELLPPPEPMSRIGLWLHLPAEDLAYARSLSLAAAPPLCSAPPRL